MNLSRAMRRMFTNDDGSIDLYFGPKVPKGKEANWIQTVPKKGWFCLLRLSAPPKRGLTRLGGRVRSKW